MSAIVDKRVGFFGRRFQDKYGRDSAVWTSVGIYFVLLWAVYSAFDAYNPLTRSRSIGGSFVLTIALLCAALAGAAFFVFRVCKLLFDIGSGVDPTAAAVACHALAAGTAYLVWGLVDRCVRADAPRTKADGTDFCGGAGACNNSVDAKLIPLAAVACDVFFFGVLLAGAASVSAADRWRSNILTSTGVSSDWEASRDLARSVVSYAKVAISARALIETCKLVFDYEADIVASFEDPQLRNDLLSCHSIGPGSRRFGSCPESGIGSNPRKTGTGAAGATLNRDGHVAITTLKVGVRRSFLETVGLITAFASIVFVYNMVPSVSRAVQGRD